MPHRFPALISISVLLALPTFASASTTDTIIKQCINDGSVSSSFSQGAYSKAISDLPADIDEYTDCRDLIRRASLAAAGVGGSSKASETAAGVNPSVDKPVLVPATAEEAAAIKKIQKNGDRPIKIDGETVTPGSSGFVPSALHNSLPTPVLIVLFLLGFGAIAGIILTIRARSHD